MTQNAPGARRAAGALAAFALALFAASSLAPPASAAVTTPLQQSVSDQCGTGFCRIDFIDLADNAVLDLDQVWCEVTSTGQNIYRVEFYYLPAPPSFSQPLTLAWHRLRTTTAYSTFTAATTMRVPKGRSLHAGIHYSGSGTPFATCGYTGERTTY